MHSVTAEQGGVHLCTLNLHYFKERRAVHHNEAAQRLLHCHI